MTGLLPIPRRRTLALALAAAPVCLLLAQQDADISEKLYQSGERAYHARSYAEAFETWNQLLQAAPKSPFAAQALIRMARYHLGVEKNPEAALPLLERLKTEHIKSPIAAEAMLLRGEILAKRARKPADMKEAIAEFNRVVDLYMDNPAVAGAHYQLGLAFRDQSNWGRALQSFLEAYRLDPLSPFAPKALLQAAEVLDIKGDLLGCLRLLERIRERSPGSPEARDAAWRIAVRVKWRMQKSPLKSEGLWPPGKAAKWVNTPTLLTPGPDGDLYIYEDGLDRADVLRKNQAAPVGGSVKGAKAMMVTPDGLPWFLTKQGLVKEDGAPMALSGNTPTGGVLDRWGTVWVGDRKVPALTLVDADGQNRALPSPTTNALAPLPTGGVAQASDANRDVKFLDAVGQPRVWIPYGKGLPGVFRYVLALGSDAIGHVAAIVDGGDFEGVVLWGPDGSVLRQATWRQLGISGKFVAIALDRNGGLILADRSNDLLLRLN
ncbi:MAG: tetratricopeptide repeat protein [Acidobacteriota bacterium]|nr:tetratricopeptide repeat protein [Acidobacteriota bacterium]